MCLNFEISLFSLRLVCSHKDTLEREMRHQNCTRVDEKKLRANVLI